MARRIVHGYTDMGPAEIPVLPPYITMWDEQAEGYRLLSHTGDPGSLVFAAVPYVGPFSDPSRSYGVISGPYLNGWRLGLYGGLLYVAPGAHAVASPPVYTRRGRERLFLRIDVTGEGAITYTEESV